MSSAFRSAAGALSVVTLLGLSPGIAAANPTSGVDANLVRPSLDSNGLFTLEGGALLPAHDLSVKFGIGYGQKPLQVAVPGINEGNPGSVLQYDLVSNFTVALALTEKLQIGLDAGIYRTNTDEVYGTRGRYSSTGLTVMPTGLLSLRPISNIDPSGSQTPEERAGPTDARLAIKYALHRSRSWRLALQLSASAPFGDEEMFLGDASTVIEPRFAADYALNATGTSKLVFNLAARLRRRTVLEAYDTDPTLNLNMDDAQAVLDIGSEGLAGVGISYELMPQLLVMAEGTLLEPLPEGMSFGSCRLNNGHRCSSLTKADYFNGASYGDQAAFGMAGVQYRATPDVSIVVAGGAGFTGARKDAFHLSGGIIWQPTPAGTRVIGRGDSDGDGIPDSVDICPDEPEDKDGYQDNDGCPDLDNDGDGIIDASDSCPNAPEDKDGFQDDDGCPDRDNDGDGIPDVADRCPNEPEDKDNFEDQDGCPDEDNDGDGFPDDKDQCPNQKETVNGYQDNDGCPDQMNTGPVFTSDRIDLQGAKIDFASARSSKLTAASRQLLDQIATLLKDPKNKNVIIRIESHVALSTHSKNKRVIARAHRRDKAVTTRRAKAVYDYLVSKGVDRNQLRQDSIGSSRPLQQPASDPINDRIEFIRQ